MSNIPSSWIVTKIEDVCHILDSARIPINAKERNARIEGRAQSELYPYYGATGEVGKIDGYLFEGEHILLGEDGAPFLDPFKDKAYLVDGKFWVNNHAHILTSSASNRFICHYFNKFNYSEYVTGTTRLKLNQSSLKEIPLPLPPLNEQKRIVAKIEVLFGELEAAVASLKKAQAQLKTYRQALLKHAFEGKLTAAWRAAHADQLKDAHTLLHCIKAERQARYEAEMAVWEGNGRRGQKPRPPKNLPPLTPAELDELPQLPAGWAWERVGQLSEVSGGLTKNQKRYGLPNKRPFLRVANVYANRLDLEEVHEIGITDGEIDRVLLQKGDLLIVEGNGSIEQIGRVAVWDGSVEGCVHQNHLIKARLSSSIKTKFVLYFLMSELGRRFIVQQASSTSGLHTLSLSKVESLFVPVCLPSEQNGIISALDAYSSQIDALEQTITTALQQAESLRQSILKRAFSGQLVPQDPNDEPAAALLARIRAAKESARNGIV
jgi:type I restriction enzyme, S subunit